MSQIRSSYTDSINFYGGHSPLDLAQKFGTPLYVYNETVLRQRCRELKALSSLPGFGVNYSVKANTNPVLLRIIREEGLVVDAMSPGELYMDQLAGFTADEILYISNNISEDELRNAVRHGVLISVDSLSQVETLGRVNPGGKVMVRFNPGIGAGHHAKVVTAGKETKFGVSPELLDDLGSRLHGLISGWAEKTGYTGRFLVEPGRYVVAECGVLLGSVNATKTNGDRRYAGTDLGFNVLVRPAMYDSFHDVEVYRQGAQGPDTETVEQSVVGNICESGDILAKNRQLPLLHEGDVLGVLDAGAYGFVMSSSYNQRCRAAEILIQADGSVRLIRRRETLEDLAACYEGLL